MSRSVKCTARAIRKNLKEKRIDWAQKYMTINFQNVFFEDEATATLDGPDN